MKKILIIAAHPDDEVLGCFGTISKLIKEGNEAYTLILGKGKTSRVFNKSEIDNKEFEILENEALKANQSIGIKKLFREKFPDNRFDNVPLLDIVKSIEKIKNKLKPDIIFTHFGNDLNIDHQITFKAVLTATRPMPNESVKEIYSFEVLSSTEWNYPTSFSPNTFVDISDTLESKVKAMSCYKSELCEFPHPRSLEGIKLQAKYQGLRVGVNQAEAFQLVRAIYDDGISLKDFCKLNLKELEMVLEWRNHKSVSKFMKTQNISFENHLEFIRNLEQEKNKKYFLISNKNQPIGVIYFTNITQDSCEFGLYAKPNLKGVGQILMQEIKKYAFDTLKIKELKACVFKENERALNLYLKNGFNIVKKDEKMFYIELHGGGIG